MTPPPVIVSALPLEMLIVGQTTVTLRVVLPVQPFASTALIVNVTAAALAVEVGQKYETLWDELRAAGYIRVRIDGFTHSLDKPPEIDRPVDPVIDAYKRDVDRTLIRRNLSLTPEQREILAAIQQVAATWPAS